MKHKLLFRRFIASLLLLAVSALSWAYEFEVGGIYYNRSGSVYLTDYVYVTYKTISDSGYSGVVSIPDSVTYEDVRYAVKSIGSYAFRGCSGLKSITIPNSVTSIGDDAFKGCSGLKSITIPNSVTSIGEWVFSNCYSLTSINIPESVTSIGSTAFSGCSGLTSIVVAKGNTIYDSRNACNAIIESTANALVVGCKNTTIPNNVTSIGSSAFRDCSGLTSFTIPESVQSINESAFQGCSNLTDVTINSNAIVSKNLSDTKSLNNIFGKQVTKYTLGESVTSIGNNAFRDCSGLTKAEFASIESLCSIRFGNFSSNPLSYAHHLYIEGQEVKDVVIPESVTSIGNYTFGGCSGLTSITIPESVTSIGEAAFKGCSGLTSITIPESVTSIGLDAFYNCSGLTSVTIPESVQSINESAFQGCSNLTDVTINSNAIVSKNLSYTKSLNNIFGKQVTKYTLGESVTSIGNYTFNGCSKLTSITIPNSVTSIGDLAFQQCTGLTSIIIPNSVTSIGVSAFLGCSGLKSITIPNSVTSIGLSAFRGCSGLTSFTIPESVTSIGNYTFYGCSKLTSITIPNSVTSIGDFAFSGCTSLPVENNLRYADTYLVQAVNKTQGNYTIKSGTRFIGSDAFYNCSRLTSFIVPEGVTSIGAGAFYNCTGLMTINIPNSVTSIGNYAFYGCSKLTSITIPNSVTSIGDYAFLDCSGLKSITIPNSVTSIGHDAFSGCSGLTSVIIGDGVTSIGDYAFLDCSGLTSITIPESVTSIGEAAFQDCSGLTSVTIPNSVTSIGRSAFNRCSGLTSVIIGDGVTSIGHYAFYGCSGLTSVICYAENVPTISSTVFGGVPKSAARLYVPASSIDAYKAADQWKDFDTILPIPGPTTVNMQISGTAKMGTFCAPFDVTIPAGVTASVVTKSDEGNWLELTNVEGTIKAGTPVILEAENKVDENIQGIPSVTEPDNDGILKGVFYLTTLGANSGDYIMQYKNSKTAFYLVNSSGIQVGANRCYLHIDNDEPAARIAIGREDATGIQSHEQIENGAMTRKNGKYLVEGRIIIVKDGKVYNTSGKFEK